MTTDKQPVKIIENIVSSTLDILQEMDAVPGLYDDTCRSYKDICLKIPEQIRDGRLKVAVVGVIKSGKSTLVNSLIGKDLVKRGAGVITSITTRIRKGKKNRATIYFKSWDQINAQLAGAIEHFPLPDSSLIPPGAFDLRRKNDRAILESIYLKMTKDLPASSELAGPETLMIRHAIKGFDACRTLVQADESDIVFTGRAFERHKEFTSNADKAFFLKDVVLEIYGKAMAPDIELADCQGADATDPASLKQVLAYLDQANLIIYCISSRNGLRKADVSFLNRIKKLGLIDHVHFVNNCDFSEHDTFDNLKEIEHKILQDLEYIVDSPEIVSFSSLFHLFESNLSRLSDKDRRRFLLWQEEKKMVSFSQVQFNEFNQFFSSAADTFKHRFLIANHLGRINIMLSGLNERVCFYLDLLSSKRIEKDSALKNLEAFHLNASRLESIVSNSIEAAIDGLKKEIRLSLDTVFKEDDIQLLSNTRQHVDQIPVDTPKYRQMSGDYGFRQILYLVFQDFRRDLERYVVENVDPELKRLVKRMEDQVGSHFQFLLDSYQIDLMKSEVETDFFDSMPQETDGQSIEFIDIARIKEIMGLTLPPRIFYAVYSARLKAGVMAGFGISTLASMLSALFEKRSPSFSPGLQKASRTMKLQTKKILAEQMNEYRSSLANDYFSPMIEAATREFKKIISRRFSSYQSFKESTEKLMDMEFEQKQHQKRTVSKIKSLIKESRSQLENFIENLSQEKY